MAPSFNSTPITSSSGGGTGGRGGGGNHDASETDRLADYGCPRGGASSAAPRTRLTGLLGIAGLGDSSQTTAHTSIQTLMLTTYEGKEAEYIDMKAYNIDYCLHPPNTTPSTPLRYYIDGELVFECNTNETAECKGESTTRLEGSCGSQWIRWGSKNLSLVQNNTTTSNTMYQVHRKCFYRK